MESVAEQERKRIRAIHLLGYEFGRQQDAEAAIENGMSVDTFREKYVKSIGQGHNYSIPDEIGLTKREISSFSVVRALASLVNKGDLRDAPFEYEVHQTYQKQSGRVLRGEKGFHVPSEVLREKRDLTVGTATAGGHTVATDVLGSSFIDILRNSMQVARLGATILDGLVGDVAIPRQTGAATAFWIAENANLTESDHTFDQVPMTPTTVGGFTDLSRRLLLQSSIDVEAFVRRDLAAIIGLAVDLAAINGSGAGNQPLGILGTAGIGDVDGAGANGDAPTWADIVNLEKEVAVDNAAFGRLGYLTNSSVVAKLKITEKAASTAKFLIEDKLPEGGFMQLNGHRLASSNQVPNNLVKGASGATLSAIIFGNWADLLIGQWGGLDILVDPFTGGISGRVRVIAMRDTDIAIRHPQSFSAKQDTVTT